MQLAIDEVGAPRILLAAGVSAVTKPFGVHGLFYRVAGPQAAAIDGPTSYTIPPYNESATLGPKDPDGAARRLAAAIDRPVAVIDANDAGCNVLGASPGVDRQLVKRLFADNPLGQAREQTPIAVVRRLEWPADQPLPAGAEAAAHAALTAAPDALIRLAPRRGDVAQLGEHLLCKEGVGVRVPSSPPTSRRRLVRRLNRRARTPPRPPSASRRAGAPCGSS